jgi:putative NIF3 family GTP cyclohydrolase 1 type 2
MNSKQIMDLALEMAGLDSLPPDSAIYTPTEPVRSVYLGIDIVGDDLYRAVERGCDLVLSHHPLNRAPWFDVLDRHSEFMADAGVPFPDAAKILADLKAELKPWADNVENRNIYRQLTPLAESLGLGLMNIHQPLDELGRQILQREANTLGESATVAQLVDRYSRYKEIATEGETVEAICSGLNTPIGKTVVVHAAGTDGGYAVADAMFTAGIGTVVYIHCSEEAAIRISKEGKGNLIVTGHYGSDSLGINPFVDELEARGIEVFCCNHMTRVSHEHRTNH